MKLIDLWRALAGLGKLSIFMGTDISHAGCECYVFNLCFIHQLKKCARHTLVISQ